MYDYLIVGAGLFGAVFARQITDAGAKCYVIDRRKHIDLVKFSFLRKKLTIYMFINMVLISSIQITLKYGNI